MSKQVVTFGTPPTGIGGDSYKTAFTKCNENFTEVYDKIAYFDTSLVTKADKTYVDSQLSLKAGKADVIDITKGGTGATTAAAARTNLGLDRVNNTSDAEKPISVATQQALDTKYDKADLQSSFDAKVDRTDVIAISNGGTGATSVTEARANLGLGDAATKNVGTSTGNVMQVGAFGIGGNAVDNYGVTGLHQMPSGFFRLPDGSSLRPPNLGIYDIYGVNVKRHTINHGAVLWLPYATYGVGVAVSAYSSTSVTHYHILTDRNTTTDSNGFIKKASPIVQLFADKIELNDEAQQQEIVFEKLGVGDYLIKGSTGLSNDGWYIEQPKDANGNIYHAIEYGTHDNGDIWVKTYEQKIDGTRIVADHSKPIDIIENRFISIRLNELPEDTTAPINPTVKDNEGNAAPSRLHELVNGIWVISDENAAILEQERLAAMPALTRRQFRLTLAMNGYDLKEIEALIDQIEDPMQRTIAQIEWQDATDFERTNPTLLMMASKLGLDTQRIDDLWDFGLSL